MGARGLAGLVAVLAVLTIGSMVLLLRGPERAPPPTAGVPSAGPAGSGPIPAPAASPVVIADPVPADAAEPSAPDATDLSAARRITGIVRYTETQDERAPDVLVVLSRGPAGSRVEVARTRTDAEGGFAFEGVGPGTHEFSTLTAEGECWDTEHEAVTLEGNGDPHAELWVERPLPPGTGIRVRGTVKYEDGRPVKEFRFDLDLEDRSFLVCGSDGVFERRLPQPGSCSIWSVHADGEEWDDLSLHLEATEGTPVEIVLPLAKDASLIVVDGETGTPLPSARAYRHREGKDEWAFDDYPSPSTLEGECLAADSAGRIPLGPGKGTQTVFVVADGRAWRRVEVGREGSAGTRVALEPGGSLRLTVAGWASLEDATVFAECEQPWRGWHLPAPGPEGQAEYNGLPEGVWKVVVRRDWQWKDGEVYGEGEVTVRRSAETALTIATRPPSAGAPVPVSGTVTFAAAWGLRHGHLTFEGAEPRNRIVDVSVRITAPGDGSPVAFALDPIPPGEYQVKIDPQFHRTVTVTADGAEFEFRVPPPGTLLVRVLDEATDQPVEGARVWWHAAVERRSYSLENAVREGASGAFRIVSPAGMLAVIASGPGYVPNGWGDFSSGDWEVREGVETAVTFRLQRAAAVRIQFQWEGDNPDWGAISLYLNRKDEDGGGVGTGLDVERGVARGDECIPGNYELMVEMSGGEFEDIPPSPVRLVAGETTTVPIRLVRKR